LPALYSIKIIKNAICEGILTNVLLFFNNGAYVNIYNKPFPRGIYYDSGGLAFGTKSPTSVVPLAVSPWSVKMLSGKQVAALIKKARYLSILDDFIQKDKFYQ
jgi:hypothetical protein